MRRPLSTEDAGRSQPADSGVPQDSCLCPGAHQREWDLRPHAVVDLRLSRVACATHEDATTSVESGSRPTMARSR